jgi:hypothetical protein
MRKLLLMVAMSLSAGAYPISAGAHGCIKGAAVGGVVGHVAGHHALAGAAVGCVIGHHQAKARAKAAAQAAPRTHNDPAKSPGSQAARASTQSRGVTFVFEKLKGTITCLLTSSAAPMVGAPLIENKPPAATLVPRNPLALNM